VRIAVVTNVLAHYRVPCFERLAATLPGQVTFFLLTEQMGHRQYVLADGSRQLPVVPLRSLRFAHPPWDDVHLSDVRPVLRGRFDAVILGAWNEPTYLVLWALVQLLRSRLYFWIESTERDHPRRWLRERLKRALLARAAGCIVPGQRAGEYCRSLGMPAARIHLAPNATDRVYFRGQADQLLPERDTLRRELGFAGFTVLFVGRLFDQIKAVSVLLRACGRLRARGVAVEVALAGDGPDRSEYTRLAAAEGLADVRFLGVLSHRELCRYYAAASALVLPSRTETWGFVLNEAMEFGLPLVVSDAVGGGPDLVAPGENGYVVPTGDEVALADALGRLAADEGLRLRMGQASRGRVERFSPERWAAGVTAAVAAPSHQVAA
jgi:glycosyltransferase involved in cell wall biosynthesis